VETLIAQGQSPFSQARYMSITQLAVFEAVNAITQQYEPYLGTVVAPDGASAEAAAIEAAYRVLVNYFPANPNLGPAYVASMAAIPDGQAKTDGRATGADAAAKMIALRANDGSSPAQNYLPTSVAPGVWELTPSCPAAGGVLFHWQYVTPFGVPSIPHDQGWIAPFLPPPPPSLTSVEYWMDYNEVMKVGGVTSTERPQDRADVARFYAGASPSHIFNLAARQVSVAQGRSLAHNARTLALLNMASNDALIVSFATKYHYLLWRPESAIRRSDEDGNPKTAADTTFAPYITTPCFPSYPSNHASGSSSAADILRRVYGAAGHDITMSHPATPDVVLHYTAFHQITADIDDARVYGGIHFRFDQEAGGGLARQIADYIIRNNLRKKPLPVR
jgi:PAP2 superfamily